jgi:hypothetical protein
VIVDQSGTVKDGGGDRGDADVGGSHDFTEQSHLSSSMAYTIGWTTDLISGRQQTFFLSTASRLALGTTQPPIEWVQGGSFPGGKMAWV